jgi:hypothetical protein
MRRAFAEVAAREDDVGPIDDIWEDRHSRYHFALISACGSGALLSFCAQLHDRFDRYRRLALPSKAIMAGIAGDHDEIADAALTGAVAHAVALLDRHIAEMGAPGGDLQEDRHQRDALFRRPVDNLASVRGVRRAGDDAVRLEPLQAIGQDVGRYTLLGGEQLAEVTPILQQQVAQDEQRPAVAEDAQGVVDRTVRAPPGGILRHGIFSQICLHFAMELDIDCKLQVKWGRI